MTLEQVGAMDFDVYVEFVAVLKEKLERETWRMLGGF